MSLVSDALRKARREAAERGDNLGERATPTTVVHISRGSGLAIGIATGAGVALVAALAVAAVVWWTGAQATVEIAEATGPAAPPDAIVPSAPPGSRAGNGRSGPGAACPDTDPRAA